MVAVPSYSEVVGLVNLEAGVCGTPSITTHQSGLHDWADGGGLLIEPDIGQLMRGLQKASRWDEEERHSRGRKIRNFVIQRYSLQAVGRLWSRLYDELADDSVGCQ